MLQYYFRLLIDFPENVYELNLCDNNDRLKAKLFTYWCLKNCVAKAKSHNDSSKDLQHPSVSQAAGSGKRSPF